MKQYTVLFHINPEGVVTASSISPQSPFEPESSLSGVMHYCWQHRCEVTHASASNRWLTLTITDSTRGKPPFYPKQLLIQLRIKENSPATVQQVYPFDDKLFGLISRGTSFDQVDRFLKNTGYSKSTTLTTDTRLFILATDLIQRNTGSVIEPGPPTGHPTYKGARA